MTGAHHINGSTGSPFGTGPLGQIGRALALATAAIAAAVILFFSAAFALFLFSGLALIALIAVAFFWVRAKLTGRPFGPRAQMEELRRQMEAQLGPEIVVDRPRGADSGHRSKAADGPIIDAQETPEGWTVER